MFSDETTGNLETDMSRKGLIATLGSETQMVTLSLDLLEAKGWTVVEVIVLYTDSKAMRPALARLWQEFASGGVCKCKLCSVVAQDKSGPVGVTSEMRLRP